ncbi:pimeloyl-ACP methyl ester carboxylesterase [Paenibacillus endophyticus]|uniref:Pimeloyl-ACP methyl ester carboxylesterase n=1 Tax=Paenibacillus endophyticus TaxID=1294268 RepID=A0A7W5G8M9_9BACL|nr:cohesin domain-containing protein [Paenibacillus endophyticus]MBB3150428.1 pimeloyl-ACP methyl ester carboxylesterase [Paenibacillus endophyticus]
MFKKRFITLYLFLIAMVFSIPSAFASEATPDITLPFILKNVNFAFEERTDAVIIDAGKIVSNSKLSVSDFNIHVKATRKVNADFVVYDGPRVVTDVYTSQVNDSGTPSDTGRYIVVDFADVGWGDGGTTIDGGYTLNLQYTITLNGNKLEYVDGSSIVPAFNQTGAVSPVLDKYKYANYDGLDYSYFYNEDAEEPLPLVVFFHGGGQGNDIYTPIRFSNGGTVWANPENQAKYPTHVLAPRNATTVQSMHKVKAIIDDMIDAGKVDPNRVYITGFSMGGGSTWTFLQTYPDFAAAAAPLCPAGGPGNVENALKVANLPLWTFVDAEDFLYNSVVNTDKTYSPYWNDSLLTIIPFNQLLDPPYNGHRFDGHSVWLPVYNEYVHPERGMLIDWLFSQSKIKEIANVEVATEPGVAPVLPETVAVDVNHSATGIATEERAVVWEAIDPQLYKAPGVFEVAGTIEDIVEKVTAKVTVVAASATLSGPALVQPGQQFDVTYGLQYVKKDVYAQDITIKYDAVKLELAGQPVSLDSEKFKIVDTDEQEGIIRILGIHLNDSANNPNKDLIKLSFKAKETAGISNIEVSLLVLADGEGVEVEAGGDTHTVEIRKPTVPGDINDDDRVSVGDLALVAKAYGKSSDSPDWNQVKKYDINADGTIDIEDLSALARLILKK